MEMPVEGVFHNLVITKINKEYAGQGQKVMNAMWGAGQMMFNKILVIAASKNHPIGNSRLIKSTNSGTRCFKNLNPGNRYLFFTGPNGCAGS